MSRGKVTVRRPLVAGLSVVGCASFLYAPAAWADFAKGKAAFERQDYALAYRELLPEAQTGNPEAEYMVGEMTADGLPELRRFEGFRGAKRLFFMNPTCENRHYTRDVVVAEER